MKEKEGELKASKQARKKAGEAEKRKYKWETSTRQTIYAQQNLAPTCSWR